MNKFPSKIYYIELLKSLMDEHFAYNSSLRCLINSNKFLNQILDLYKKFYYLVVSQDKLSEILNNTNVDNEDKISIIDLLVLSNLVSSKGEARRLIEQGGVSVDESKVTDANMPIPAKEFVLHKGKKVHLKIVVK